MTAQARGWGPPPVHRSQVGQPRAPESGATFPGGGHEQVLELANTLLAATEARGYYCVVGWCWGYAPRRVRGSSTTWSNHAWALALDINAPNNPMSSRLVTDMPAWMPRMWEDCGFRWGGRYRTRPDAMHYEYMGHPQDVAGHLAKARRYLAGYSTAGITPEPIPVAPELDEEEDVLQRGDRGGEVKVLQWRINQVLHGESDPRARGNDHGLVVDGDFGPSTESYVKHLQSGFGYATTGRYDLALAMRMLERLIQVGIIRPKSAA